MLVYLILSLYSLFNQNIFFAPLFLFVYLYLKRKHYLLTLLLLGLSFLGDLVWVFPLGFSGLFFSLFLAVLSLYSHRYNVLNSAFLFSLLLVGSGIMFFLVRPNLNYWMLFCFFGLMIFLLTQIRELHKNNLKLF